MCLSLRIQEVYSVGVKDPAYLEIFAATTLYLVGVESAFELQHFLKQFDGEVSPKVFRLSLSNARYTNLEYKLFVLRISQVRNFDRKACFALGKQLGIVREDVAVFWHLFVGEGWFRKQVRAAASRVSRNHPLLHVPEVELLFKEVFPAVNRYIKFLCYNKLRFLVRAENETFEDYHHELGLKVLQAFHSIMPVEATDAYVTNYLKRVAHNRAINIIKEKTSLKRGRLVNTGVVNREQTFSLLCVSQNQVNSTEVDLLEVANSSDETFQRQFSICQVLDSVKRNQKKYRFISLLLGVEDAEFTHWLQQERVASVHEDNVTVQERVSAAEFNMLVAEFLKVAPNKANAFLSGLRDLVAA